MKLTENQKIEFINANAAEFFTSPKTSTPEYKANFEAMDINKQYATILRWTKYNEAKATGNIAPRTTKKVVSPSPVSLLMDGDTSVEITNEDATSLIEKFMVAIEALNTIIKTNKEREKEELKQQIDELKKRLKSLD